MMSPSQEKRAARMALRIMDDLAVEHGMTMQQDSVWYAVVKAQCRATIEEIDYGHTKCDHGFVGAHALGRDLRCMGGRNLNPQEIEARVQRQSDL